MRKFIVIDGLDGSGKDTQVNLLAKAYENRGRKVTVRSHPCSDNKFGRRSVHMYCRNDDVDVLIFSRYILAVMYLPNVVNTIVYKIVAFVLPTSDCMFFLDITPEESLRRIGARDEETEMFENIESLRENREKSRKFTYNWNVVSADDSPDVISEKIVQVLQHRLAYNTSFIPSDVMIISEFRFSRTSETIGWV